mgnify:CR=1 FL=1
MLFRSHLKNEAINQFKEEFSGIKLWDENFKNKHTNMKIVHSHIEIFDKNPNTLDGWTSCLLLDASHFTSHCYSDKGLISFDLFTCGSTNTLLIMNIFLEDLKKIINFNSSKIQYHKRFIY